MKRLIHFLLFIVLVKVGYGQPTRYGNEWIDYSRTYAKVYVTIDGMYHVPYSLLSANIPNINAVNPVNFVMVHNGLPIPIYVKTNTAGTIDSNTYIEFYGKKNIGDVDSVLYFGPGYQAHPYYSSYTDTSVYFLTVNNLSSNPRFTFVNNDTAAASSITEEQYFWFSSHIFYTSSTGSFSPGNSLFTGADYLYKCIYDKNEGWGKGWINYNSASPLSVTIPTNSLALNGPQATFNFNIYTRTWEQHNVVTTLNSNPLQTLNYDNSSGGHSQNIFSVPVSLSSLSASNTLKVSETSFSTSGNENLLMFAEILYPRLFQFDNLSSFRFQLSAAVGQRYFRVSNYSDAGSQPLLYDLTNGLIIRSTDAPAVYPKTFVLPVASGSRDLFIRADNASNYTVISRMDTVTFINYKALASQGNYLVISNKILYSDSLGHNWVQDYVNYRDRTLSPNTGHFNARLFDIDQLTDQFAYGVKKTPLAIRNFIEYAYDNWSQKPEYLFLIGKATIYYTNKNGLAPFSATACYNMNIVPTFGQPGSDDLLVCRRGSNRPLVAVGRLAARSGTDVAAYLTKMRIYEGLQNAYGDPHQTKDEKLWMKQIMHMAGGSDVFEQNMFSSYLYDYEKSARDTSWGANIFTFKKTVSDPIDNSQADLIRQHINNGASLITFFGHAAPNAFDISIDNPEVWTNLNKYPLIYSNGCFAGNISDANFGGVNATLGERFVMTPNKGAIAFTATSGLSVSNSLDDYARASYYNFCQKDYDKPWGKAMQNAQISIDSLYGTEDFTIAVAYEMTLHGDPAVYLNQYNVPDYQIDQSSVFFTPQTINASIDSFNVNVIVTNLGRAIKDSIQITITRSYPDPTNPSNTLTKTYLYKVKATYYMDTFSFKIPTFPALNQGFGQNQFTVFVESGQRIAELSETNNGSNLQYGLFIESNDILPIYPYEFAIVPKQNLTVKASTVDPFAKVQTYRLQVDTSGFFLHPLAQTTIRQPGGIIHWTLPITFRDSTVYYWRVSRDSINDTLSYKWHATSFLYLKNEYPGWNQSHFYQYQRDNYHNVYIANDRVFKFVPTVNTIGVTTGWCTAVGAGGPSYFTATNLNWRFNQNPEYNYRMGNCGSGVGFANPVNNGGFTFAVIDTFIDQVAGTNHVWTSVNNGPGPYGQFGNIHCFLPTTSNIQSGFDFSVIGNHGVDVNNPSHSNVAWAKLISDFIDSIPDGSIMLMYAVSKPQYRSIDTTLVNKLSRMGATLLHNLCIDTGNAQHSAAPYIFWTVKGNPAKSGQAIGHDYSVPLDTSFDFGQLWNKGTYISPNIGPATQWGSFHWRWRPKDHPAADIQHVDIVGVQPNGTQTTLLSTTSLDTTLNYINPRTYPYIFLRMNVQNDTAHVPSQLYYWRVLYKKAPEAAMNPAAHFLVQRDTVGLGDSLNVEIALENVSDVAMDSIRTQYTLKSLQNGYQQNIITKQDSLRVSDTLILKFKQKILNPSLSGRDQLVIEANPEDQLHQLEEYHFNNYAVVNFSTTGDNVNPLLDVTFDSKRILNGDLVSAKPDILVTLKDENKYLALNDTALAQVYVRFPGQTIPTLVNYDNNILTFYPATGNIAKRNQAKIEFKPTFIADGTYDLLIRDKDRSGNFSSSSTNRYEGTNINGVYYDYKVTFNIINKSMITNVLNYPNPFSTRTQFVFTLTGSEIPDYMKIQIMTITGKVVKEITKEQLGNIHVGTNITDYYWDGRDQYGDKLANGVYFYRVIADINHKQIDHMSSTQYGQFFNNTNIDKYFKNGFGKLVIMR